MIEDQPVPRAVIPTYCVPECAGLDLVAELEALPTNPSSAMRILQLAADANSSAADLGTAVGSDPSLTARIMKVANSAYYGLSGRVSSATFAVTVLGFDTVRAIAAAAAGGVTDDYSALPERFWSHSALVAVACSLVAPRLSVRGPEAFSLGLLHDLGDCLLQRGLGPLPPDAPAEERDAERLAYERARWGVDHAAAAGRVLGAWSFPEEFTHAIALHHDGPRSARSNLQKVLIGGEALARCAEGAAPASMAQALALVELAPADTRHLAERTVAEAEGLAASLVM
jgi:HD-like signal output (HDOD) protein